MKNTTRNDDHPVTGIEELPRTVAPRRDLWPDIEARLESRPAERRTRRWLQPAAAAGVAAVFAAGILLGRQFSEEPQPSAAAGPADLRGLTVENVALRAAMHESEREYQAAFREFIPVGSAQAMLAPQSVERIRSSWRDLQQAEAALLAALEKHPENTYLNQKLLDLRSQQLEFMQQLANADRSSRRKT